MAFVHLDQISREFLESINIAEGTKASILSGKKISWPLLSENWEAFDWDQKAVGKFLKRLRLYLPLPSARVSPSVQTQEAPYSMSSWTESMRSDGVTSKDALLLEMDGGIV